MHGFLPLRTGVVLLRVQHIFFLPLTHVDLYVIPVQGPSSGWIFRNFGPSIMIFEIVCTRDENKIPLMRM